MTRRVHPRLAALFDTLDQGAVRWCVLRGERQLADPPGDVDLLVGASPRHLDKLLASQDFRRLPAPLLGPHRFYVTWDAATARWLKIDIVSELAYGPGSALRTDAAAPVLSRRTRQGGVWLPAPEDRLFALLLHQLLDKEGIRPLPGELSALAEVADAAGPLAELIDRVEPAGETAGTVRTAVRNGDLELLEAIRTELVAGLARRSGPAGAARRIGHRVARPVVRRLAGGGLLVALLGPDGAGKSSTAEALVAAVPVPAQRLYLGLASDRGGHAGLRLVGRIGRTWRAYLRARAMRARGDIAVFDRYPVDALLAGPAGSGRVRLRRALVGHSLPAPDLIIVLDAPGHVLYARKGEHDPVHLERQRQRYAALARRLPRATSVDATAAAGDVQRQVSGHVWQVWARELGGRGG